MGKWPVYKDRMLVLGNPQAAVGVVTLWTKREKVAQQLDPHDFAAVGSLYSDGRGIDFLLANILAHPFLNRLIVCGRDGSGSGQSLLDFFRQGVDQGKDRFGRPCWLIRGQSGGRVSLCFDFEDLLSLRRTVEVIDLRNTDLGEVSGYIPRGARVASVVRDTKVVELADAASVDAYPSEEEVMVVRGRTVAEVWLQILDLILKFGVVSGTQFQSQQRELLNLISIITEEDPDDPFIPLWFPNDRESLERYHHTVLEVRDAPAGASYTYGDRMRVRWGDQIRWGIETLRKSPETRRVVLSLWDPHDDRDSAEPPCINHLWFRIRGGKLTLTVTIRSNDMFHAYPANAMAMRKLQKMVTGAVGVGMGSLVINSQSAHIYDDAWDYSQAVVVGHWKEVVSDPRLLEDPRGNFLISTDGEEIVVEHEAPTGELLQTFRGRTALSLYLKLAPFISYVEHAAYLGAELQKAEQAIKFGLVYVQDQPLVSGGSD